MSHDAKAVLHPLEPVFDAHSRVLILGTMPSPTSREHGFYYAHPQNRFWQVLAVVLGTTVPPGAAERKAFLLHHKIAVWDVLQSCIIHSADDASIRQPVANDFTAIFAEAPLRAVFTTGKQATNLYKKHCMSRPGTLPPHYLPSTSGANAAFSLDRLVEDYRAILPYLYEPEAER